MDKMAQEALQHAMAEGAEDPAFWLRFFLPHLFPSEIPPFHMALIALQTKQVSFLNKYPSCHDFLLNHVKYKADPDDPTSIDLPVFRRGEDGLIYMVAGDHDNWLIPRGFSKTTLTVGLCLREILVFKTFLVYISKSATHAEMQLGNIRAELEENELLRAGYGNLVPSRSDSEKWSAGQLVLLNGSILVARGRGGQVRGLNYRGRRPNKIVLDDVEDDGSAESETMRTATKNWFYSAVEKAGQLMEGMLGKQEAQEPLHIINLGTLLGADCLMMTLAKDPKFSTIQFGAKLPDGQMLWAFKMSAETYEKERNRHRRLGMLASFTREMDSAIRISDDTLFPSVFIYQPTTRADLANVALAMDPAISKDKKADHAALVVAGRRASDGALWALDEWGGQGKTPRELIDKFFELHLRWNTTHNGIEAQQFQAALIFLMREEMAKRKYFFHITPIVQGKHDNKILRVEGMLSPRYTNGFLRHLRPLAGIEGNLADWPNGKKDYADALTMALKLLGETQMMALPEGEEHDNTGDYAPQENVLPPAYNTVSNYIIPGSGHPHDTRYPR